MGQDARIDISGGLTVTLKDIAREAGVSLMTVSRALRKQPRVSRELQSRIQAIADRLGYRPNPMVSALMRYRQAGKPVHYDLKLGFVTSFPTRDGWKKFRLFREFHDGAALGADRQGYQLEEFWLGEPGMTPRRMSQVLLTRNIQGVLLGPLAVSRGRAELDWSHLCAVAFGYSIVEPALHRVANHQFLSILLAMQKLRAKGYRRPGLAFPASLDDRVFHQWLAGFLVEQRNFPGRQLPLFLVPDEKWNSEKFLRWVERDKPDVVIGHQKEPLLWLQQSGRRVPKDVGFIHLDCPLRNGHLSGIYQNGQAIGTAATDMLASMLQRNEVGIPLLPRTVLIEGSWVDGATLKSGGGGELAKAGDAKPLFEEE